MIKKVILNTLFGAPYPDEWIYGFVDNVQHLAQYGWEWKIFTPHPFISKGNVKFIPMDLLEFNHLVEKTTGVSPRNYIDETTRFPKKLMTDYAPALAVILSPHLKGFEWWGHVNWDVVYGRLDKWMTDEFLKDCDIFGNDPDAINGVFSIYRNIPVVNELFYEHPSWKDVFINCDTVYTFEEQMFTDIVRQARDRGDIRFKSAWWLQHDRMDAHQPVPKLITKPDGSLVNKDGEEMMLFHFSKTKKWPL